MAFGLKRKELNDWKEKVQKGEIAILTHYWLDERFPESTSVTKVGCKDIPRLVEWGRKYGLKEEWIHMDETYPHFDLFAPQQEIVLKQEEMTDQLERFIK